MHMHMPHAHATCTCTCHMHMPHAHATCTCTCTCHMHMHMHMHMPPPCKAPLHPCLSHSSLASADVLASFAVLRLSKCSHTISSLPLLSRLARTPVPLPKSSHGDGAARQAIATARAVGCARCVLPRRERMGGCRLVRRASRRRTWQGRLPSFQWPAHLGQARVV